MAISHSCFAKLLMASLQVSILIATCSGNFYDKFDIIWGSGRAKILENGNLLTVTLDQASGSGFQSKCEYLNAKLDMQIKLVSGNSAGTVTAYYLKGEGATWDEIDFEFLGNLSGDPYTLHTNVFTHGKGAREQQFYLWFDPTADFHTYSILWNPNHIVLSVDGIPLREFKNLESHGLPYLNTQPMRLYSSLWNADNWATRGGLVKIDWSHAPFQASYRNFNDKDCCTWSRGSSSCGAIIPSFIAPWYYQTLDYGKIGTMKWARSKYMIYDYCTDSKRFPQGQPPECKFNNQ